jgi:hypothetical protein
MIRRLPRVVRRGVALPAHQVLGPTAEGLAVEKLLDDVLAFLPWIRDRAGGVGAAHAGMVGLETIYVDSGAALEATRKGQRIGIRACEPSHWKGTLPPWTEFARLRCVEQFLGP